MRDRATSVAREPDPTPLPEDSAKWPIVLDGRIVPACDATIPAADEGLIRGDGAFDAFRLYRGRPFALKEHLDRLESSCHALELSCPRRELENDLRLLLSGVGEVNAAVRIVLTRGGRRLCILEPLGDLTGAESPMRLLPVRFEPNVILNGVKSLSYAANMLASRQAAAAGFDDALLITCDDAVLEGPTCAIFWVCDGILRTPALELGILDSITRRCVCARLDVETGSYALMDLLAADEAFLASTGRTAQPVSVVGDTRLPVADGPVTKRARDELEDAIREETGLGRL